MAELKDIKIGAYVKWSVKNGVAVGEIKSIEDSKAMVETPSGPVIDVEIANLLESNEEEFSKAIDGLITTIEKKRRKPAESKGNDMNTEAETLKAENANLKSQAESLAKEVEAIKAKLAEAEKMYQEKAAAADEYAKSKDEMTKAMKELQAKCDEYMMEKAAKARWEKLKAVEATDAIASDESEALKKLGAMTEAEFGLALNIATSAFKKLTEMSKSNEKKLTEQTVSTEKKLTQAASEENAEAALETAKKEEDKTLVTVNNVDDKQARRDRISKFASAAFSVKKDKKDKK